MIELPTEDNPVVIIHGDCLDILPQIPAGVVDAVVTDPPYGIGFSGSNASTIKWEGIIGDDGSLDIRHILRMACPVLSFGANCYPEQLPHRGRWFCWDKRMPDGSCDAMLGSPFELAWCNRKSGFDKIVRVLHGGVVNADGKRRYHPTQKPVAVMREAILWACKDSTVILDPFAGSGTTGVAAILERRKAILIEKDAGYVEVIKKRIAETLGRPTTLANGKTVGRNLFESIRQEA